MNPAPKAARTTKSLSFILPCSQASVRAIITEAAASAKKIKKIYHLVSMIALQQKRRVQQMKGKSDPVKKNMDKLHKPVTHVDKKKEEKKNPSEHVRFRKNWYERP